MRYWQDLADKFNIDDPYVGFNDSQYTLNAIEDGWSGSENFYRKLIEEKTPSVIMEVGVWRGGSISYMAKVIKELDLRCYIIAIDTWLGTPDILFEKKYFKFHKSFGIVNGHPTVYQQFLANMIKQGFDNIVLPMPFTGTEVAKFFIQKDIKADLIHIDAAHDYESVKRDIYYFAQLTTKDGLLFGDDYIPGAWPGVVKAVDEYIQNSPKLTLKRDGKKWIAAKK